MVLEEAKLATLFKDGILILHQEISDLRLLVRCSAVELYTLTDGQLWVQLDRFLHPEPLEHWVPVDGE